MKTYMVQAIYGEQFEDITVKAANPKDAIAAARQLTTLKSRWTRFVL